MMETFLDLGHSPLGRLYPRIKYFLQQEITEYNVLGAHVHGYRTPDSPSFWIRDQSDMMRTFRYWERDMKSVVDLFAETQSTRGWLFDYVTMTPEKVPCERENWVKFVRVPVEADVEYRFIKAVYLVWQATGDDRWMKSLLPNMEMALKYITTDEWRWDKKSRLVKRGYSVDTWDFDYTAGRHQWLNFQLNEHTFWGIMHGDNSGYYEAFVLMSKMYESLGKSSRARYWKQHAAAIRKRANSLCFNGTFYTHHVPLVPVKIEGVDESQQLSLSNPMDINRGMATHEMSASIIREYQRRKGATKAFAEWFSIDPPFPDGIFGDEKLVAGAYCNGGIMPLVGGELARAAFEHGFEEYGVQQLLRYEELTGNNESYLWYFPSGEHATVETSTSPNASPTDAWGASAMLFALIEGLCGVVDTYKLFRRVRLSPRWIAAGLYDAHVGCSYSASGASIEYSFVHDPTKKRVSLELQGRADVDLHVLLPRQTFSRRVHLDDKPVRFRNVKVEDSPYVDVRVPMKKRAEVQIDYIER